MKKSIKDILLERILVLDGAMGTMIQSYNLTESDFRGSRLKDHDTPQRGNNDILSLTQPDIIADIHRNYLDAGADIIITNSFNASTISQKDYNTSALSYEMSFQAAAIACKSADEFTAKTPEKPRFVAGDLGPTNQTCSLSPRVEEPAYRNVTFEDLVDAYSIQVNAFLDAGVDILLVETVFDTLNCKAALYAVQTIQEQRGTELPVMVSGTITDLSGRLLSGQTVEAFWYSIRHVPLLSVGLNCAFGAEALRPFIEILSGIADTHISIHPNAGLPNETGGYDESPEFTARILAEFAQDGFVNLVGGCCGTTSEHIRAISMAVEGFLPRKIPDCKQFTRLSGLEPLNIKSDSLFVNIGERTNVAGSSRFRKMILDGQYEKALEVARHQVENGAQMIDVNMDEGLLDSVSSMTTFLNHIAAEPDISKVPIMVDSSRWDVISAGLRCIQGKAVVNSLSLKDGEALFIQRARDVRKLGAAVIIMAFD
ncbi:MAG: homocysteine S-methyltransferase family protein, partial [Fidelibacterota bacterium]